MTSSEIIASLALAVSCGSFIVAYLSFHRTRKLDEPNAWAEVAPLEKSNRWAVKVSIKNPTRYPLKIEAMSVPISRIPIDEKQDFLLSPMVGDTQDSPNEATMSEQAVGTYVKMPVSGTTIAADSEGYIEACLKRGTLSTASAAILTLHYCAMLERPRYRTLTLRAQLPSGGVTMQVSRAN